MSYTIEQLMSRYEAAVRHRSNMDNLLRDVYKYAIPYRDMMYNETEGTDKSIEIYDSTAVDSTESFANFLHNSMTPPEFRWFSFTAGADVPEIQKARVQTLLDAVTEKWFYLLWSTNFDTEINQSYRDLAAGTGAFAIRDYGKFGSDENPATFVATPPYEIYTCEGREGHVSEVYRKFKLERSRIKMIWPDADYSEDQVDAKTKESEKETVIECVYYDYNSRGYFYRVWVDGVKKLIVKEDMKYASWIVFRWSCVSGEMLGRGPLINALADIKTANKVVELILKNASIDLSGIYTAVDDGVLNVNNVDLTPGTIIPVAYNGGPTGRSLDLLPRSGDFDVSELVLKDLRSSIRRKLLDNDLAPLDDAVRAANEVALRQQNASKRAGPSIGRLRTELIFKTIKELTVMWQAKGLLPPFEIDGKMITLRFTSPLAKQQNMEDLQGLDSYIARMNAFTPGMGAVATRPEEYAHYVAEKTGIPLKLIPTKDELIQAQQIMGTKIAEGGPEGQKIVESFTQ